jgi:hypothetical protein
MPFPVYEIDMLGNQVQQTFFFVNKNLYSFSSFNENGSIEMYNSTILNSITLNNEVELTQCPIIIIIMMSFQ